MISTFWLARSILPALTLDAFGVLHTGFLTALISIGRFLSVGLNDCLSVPLHYPVFDLADLIQHARSTPCFLSDLHT